jgi:NTP pyrophosphatase (non-canonical NTP hydrolase)
MTSPHATDPPADPGALADEVIRNDIINALGAVLDADAARPAAGYRNPALTDLAADISLHLAAHFPEDTATVQQVLALAEETGEFTAAFRRWAGLARRTGTWAEMVAELADVVITAYVTADVLGIDLDTAITAKAKVIMTRGWRERPAQWACRSCGAAFFGMTPQDGTCPDCGGTPAPLPASPVVWQ